MMTSNMMHLPGGRKAVEKGEGVVIDDVLTYIYMTSNMDALIALRIYTGIDGR